MIVLFALLAAITFTPARPTVGDPITVTFPAPVTVQRSKDYEVLSQRGNTVVVRTFEPKPFVLHTSASDVVIPVHSVLKSNDKLDAAPLKPPLAERYPRAPFIAITAAALAAIAAWAAVILLGRRRMPKPEIVADPAEQFRATVLALRGDRWADLADATRRYLAATDPRWGMELTTRELLVECGGHAAALGPAGEPAAAWPPHFTIAAILRQGDLQKFSPWGAAPGDFTALARRALELIPEPPAEEKAA